MYTNTVLQISVNVKVAQNDQWHVCMFCSAGQFPGDGAARSAAGDRGHGANPGEM